MKKCNKCNKEKSVEDFYKSKAYKDGLEKQCKECSLKRNKEYRERNAEKEKARGKKWYLENSARSINYSIEYQKKKKVTDPLYKFTCVTKLDIVNSFKRSTNAFKRYEKTESILGCTIIDFIKHIKSKFTEGMTIDNHGEWHLDHIIPLSTAKTEEDVIKLCHYTNYQPLWAKDNLSKYNKI
jgi:hypothetical protein